MIAVQHHNSALFYNSPVMPAPALIFHGVAATVWRNPPHVIVLKEITFYSESILKMSKTVVDRVHRHPNQGIRVTIIGAGVAGLQAALECWRKGCEVVVLERVTELSPVGMRV
jgi:threonine dehydrogenase-like Zn-dependent dehydrogenase